MKTSFLLVFGISLSQGQLISESFSYGDGNLIGNGTWARFSGTSGQIQISNGLITLTDSNTEDAKVTFTAQSSGTIYFGFDMQLTDPSSYSGSDFEYFSGFGGSGFENRIDVAALSGSGWRPGISNLSSTAEATWASDLNYATTYRIVVGLNIGTGVSDLWIDPSSTSSTKITGTGSQSVPNIAYFYFRQDNATPDITMTVDNLSISTTFDHAKTFPVASVDNPSSVSATVNSTTQISLAWTDNSNSDNVLLAFNTENTFGTPTDGSTYAADASISGGGTVLQYSGTDSYTHSSLTPNTAYYYKVWSYDGSSYSSGVTANGTTYKIEPTNHPTSLSATTSYQSIALAWTDAVTGSQAPDGYLILGEADATITDPTDGTAVSNDTDASDNTLAMSITHGSGASYTFSSLTASTTYYFEIFSYTNSGSSIDYKTDGTIVTANATTGTTPVFVINEILADPDGSTGDANGDGTVSTTNDEFVEIINNSGAAVDISGWALADGNSDRHTVANGTTLENGEALVIFGGGTPTNINGHVFTASTGSLGLNNGGDDVTLKDAVGGTIVTYTYGAEGGDNQSIARDGDLSGAFAKHSTIAETGGVNFSPGRKNSSIGAYQPFNLTISGNAGFRMMSSPVAGTVYDDILGDLWIQGMTNGDLTTGTANVWTFAVSGQSWSALSNLNTASQTAGEGYLVYVFADTDNDGNDDLPVTLSVSGTENSASATVGSITAGEWALVGNPYASTIGWDDVTRTNVATSAYVWDDANSQYNAWNGSAGDLTNGLIAPYQGFWVQASGGTGSVTIETADKSSSAGTFYKT
ncbi:MAG: lamin tail domain-containing protein, partial [Candidatus Marinimicrobia bacterium]|nr:lamin tail domain-containing protein [Candidatus Neomarinimicrobiota bacterium]